MFSLSKTPRNQYRLDMFLGVPAIGIHPETSVFMRVAGALQGRLDIRAGCATGGDLYFEIGSRRVRVPPDRWLVSVLPKGGPIAKFRQACRSAPLQLLELRLMTSTGFPVGEQPTIAVLDTRWLDGMRNLRSDYSPQLSTCRRGTHWTFCGPASVMNEDSQTSSYMDLKFDLDYYRSPDGSPFFIAGSNTYRTWTRVASYRWAPTVQIAYVAQSCKSRGRGKTPDCNPQNYVEFDQTMRRLLRDLFEESPEPRNAASRAGAHPQPKPF